MPTMWIFYNLLIGLTTLTWIGLADEIEDLLDRRNVTLVYDAERANGNSIFDFAENNLASRTIHAINCGGLQHLGFGGIVYTENLPSGKRGDFFFGSRYPFANALERDAVLYYSERYNIAGFSYNLPIKEDGNYTVILKFAEIWLREENKGMFDIAANGKTIIKDLDIYKKARGRGVAFDKQIFLVVIDGIVHIDGSEYSKAIDFTLQFLPGSADSPKVSAILILRGHDNLPPLPKKLKKTEKLKEIHQNIILPFETPIPSIFGIRIYGTPLSFLSNFTIDLLDVNRFQLFHVMVNMEEKTITRSSKISPIEAEWEDSDRSTEENSLQIKFPYEENVPFILQIEHYSDVIQLSDVNTSTGASRTLATWTHISTFSDEEYTKMRISGEVQVDQILTLPKKSKCLY